MICFSVRNYYSFRKKQSGARNYCLIVFDWPLNVGGRTGRAKVACQRGGLEHPRSGAFGGDRDKRAGGRGEHSAA